MKNGIWKFNCVFYGLNIGFRVEIGDLLEFVMYMSGMGGNLKFGLLNGNDSKWIIEVLKIDIKYVLGIM